MHLFDAEARGSVYKEPSSLCNSGFLIKLIKGHMHQLMQAGALPLSKKKTRAVTMHYLLDLLNFRTCQLASDQYTPLHCFSREDMPLNTICATR
jgi:hypothetical protein